MSDHRCGGSSHAECPNWHPHHESWCFEDGSQCADKACECHRRWAESAPEPPWWPPVADTTDREDYSWADEATSCPCPACRSWWVRAWRTIRARLRRRTRLIRRSPW